MKGRKRIGDYLEDAGMCTRDQILQALSKQNALKEENIHRPLGSILGDELDLTDERMLSSLKLQYLDVLRSSDVFKNSREELLLQFVSKATSQIFPDNSIILRQGDKAEHLFHIVSGEVKVFLTNKHGDDLELATLHAGDCFDEIAFFSQGLHKTSVKTSVSTCLLSISQENFAQLWNDFTEVLVEYVRLLAKRLACDNDALINATNNEKAYQQFLSQQNELSIPDVIGQTRVIINLRKEIADAAAGNNPVLITGEAGTEKLVVAADIHKSSDSASMPFMFMDAEDVSLRGSGSASTDAFQLETAQSSTLFGHIRGAFPHAETDRLGLLQICRGGTVVIENIDFLSPAIQENLVHYIKNGEFHPLGSQDTVLSSIRIIGTSTTPIKKLKESGRINRDLAELLERNCLNVPSLRRRKKDLRLLVDFIIIQECFKSPDRRLIKGMSDEAYQRIMGYDWPGNMEELEVVIRRAIILAQGDYLMPDDIFVGMAPPEGKHTINLLAFDQVRKIFLNRFYPAGLQVITGVVFALIFFFAFAGNSTPDANIILVMVWAMWWPVLVISWFVGARIWCSICPMGAANDFLNRFFSLKKKVPKFVRSYGVYISAAGLAFIIYMEAATQMSLSPMATGFLLLSILSCAVLSGLIFERRLWCRYLCPLGRLAAVFSGCSVIEFRSNASICNSTCQTNACFKGTDEVPGCPLYQGPFSLRSNQNCILCGNCVKICKEASPTFNLRIPGHELWAALKTERVTAVFVPVILGTQILRGIETTSLAHFLETVTRSTWAAYAVILLVGTILSHYFLILAGNLSFGTLMDRSLRKNHLLMNAIVPLAFAFEFAYQLKPLLEHMGDFFPVLGRQIGFNLDFLSFSTSAGAARPWQVVSIFFGMLVSMLFLKVLIKNHQRSEKEEMVYKPMRYVSIILIACIYITMFILDGF